MKLIVISRAIHIGMRYSIQQWNMKDEDIMPAMEKLYARFHKLIKKRTRDWEITDYTKTLQELLSRGAICYRDVDNRFKKPGYVVLDIMGMIWPRVFENKEDAIAYKRKFAIAGTINNYKPKKK
jgi:hypothetical protein